MLDAMCDECFPPDYWTARFKFTEGWYWVAFDADQPVAFAGSRPSGWYTNAVYLSIAGVAKTHRGLGLQKRLIRKRVAHARSIGARFAMSETLNDNAPSMNNLIACGFRAFEPRVKWGNDSAVYWRKALA